MLRKAMVLFVFEAGGQAVLRCPHSQQVLSSSDLDAKSYGCDTFPVYLCHVLLCHHCICVHFRRALESQAKRCLHISHHVGLHRLPTAHTLTADNSTVTLSVSCPCT